MPSITRFPLSVTMASGITVGTFPGEVDVRNADAIRDQSLHLLDAGARPLILDLSATRFCDCAGVGAIMRVRRRALELRTRVRLVLPADGSVHRIAVMTGLTHRVDHTTTLAEALAAREDAVLG
jgi:anti-anti-sigma factor